MSSLGTPAAVSRSTSSIWQTGKSLERLTQVACVYDYDAPKKAITQGRVTHNGDHGPVCRAPAIIDSELKAINSQLIEVASVGGAQHLTSLLNKMMLRVARLVASGTHSEVGEIISLTSER